jgi:hypothetical protein
MAIRIFAVALVALSTAGPHSEAAAAPASSTIFQVMSACLRTLSESEVVLCRLWICDCT